MLQIILTPFTSKSKQFTVPNKFKQLSRKEMLHKISEVPDACKSTCHYFLIGAEYSQWCIYEGGRGNPAGDWTPKSKKNSINVATA